MIKRTFITAAFLLLAACNDDSVVIEKRFLQQGSYSDSTCKVDEDARSYNDCTCDAKVAYPYIKGISDNEVRDRLNAQLISMVKDVGCLGEKTSGSPTSEEKTNSEGTTLPQSHTVDYTITYRSPRYLGVRYDFSHYTGGAHPNGNTQTLLLDLKLGESIQMDELLDNAKELSLNKTIMQSLAERAEGEVFEENLRRPRLVKNGECLEACALSITEKGPVLIFQPYAVGPYSSGFIEVPLPNGYLSLPALREELQKKEAAQPQTEEGAPHA